MTDNTATYHEAIRNHIRQKEIDKWDQGIEKALTDTEYYKFIQEIENDTGDIHAYS